MTSNKRDNHLNKKLKEVFEFKSNDEIDEFRADVIHLDIIHEIKNIMDERGITKAELAKKLNTSKSFITQLFAGDKLLNLKTIAKLERILEVNFTAHFSNKHSNTFKLKKIG